MRHGARTPFEGRRAEDFFALKNPTASSGFEPANLGTKGQHATSRPPKPLTFGNSAHTYDRGRGQGNNLCHTGHVASHLLDNGRKQVTDKM